METNKLQVANTIKNQIGSKSLFMMGAKNFVGDDESLTFKTSAAKKITHIKIKLTKNDLYEIIFYKIKGGECVIVGNIADVFCDKLTPLIGKTCDLAVTL